MKIFKIFFLGLMVAYSGSTHSIAADSKTTSRTAGSSIYVPVINEGPPANCNGGRIVKCRCKPGPNGTVIGCVDCCTNMLNEIVPISGE